MIDQIAKQLFNDINDKVSQLNANTAGESQIGEQIKAVLEASLRKLNLVTREEFDAQQAVLLRTREKLETLEKEVEAIKAELNK